MNNEKDHSYYMDVIMLRKTVILIYLLIIIYLFGQNLLTFQLHGAPFQHVGADNFLWSLFAVQLPQLLCQGPFAFMIDLFMMISLLCLFFEIGGRKMAFLFSALFLIYYANLQAVMVHHEHSLVGCVLTLPLLFFRKDTKASWFVSLLRMYLVYIFASAAIWKIARGSAFELTHMQQVLIDQHSPYFAGYGTLYQSVIRFLIQQYLLSYLLWIIVIIFQLSTLLMLFTRRFDPMICLSIFLYLVFDFCLMNINFFPFIIFIIVFIPSWPTIASFYKSEYRLM